MKTRYVSRNLVMYSDLNGHGNLFGGIALAWIDEAAAIAIMNTAKSDRFVTKFISEINFRAPATSGDIVKIVTTIIGFGETSVILSCEMSNNTTGKSILSVDKIVFVCIGDDGQSLSHYLKFD